MAHKINYNQFTGTHSFASYGEKAWHGLGQVVDKAMTAAEAIKLANLDYEVAKCPMQGVIETENGIINSPYENRKFTYRTDNNDLLGIVSEDYEIVQNKEGFAFFDAIISEGEAIFETAGVLGKGEQIFVTAKLPEDMLVAGEPCNKYIILTNSHDGSSSIIAGFTNIRIVCNNTLQAALNGLQNKVSIRHRLGAKERLQTAHEVMQISSKYMNEVSEVFNQMAKTPFGDDQLKKYVEDVMRPVNYDPNKEESTIFKNRVNSIVEFAHKHPTQTTAAAEGTLWGAYNAISGYYNHICEYRTPEQKMKSQLFGRANNSIVKAFTIANDIMISSN